MKLLGLLLALLALTSCALYTPQNISEWKTQMREMDASGCLYFRARATPYADASILYVATYGRNAPKYLDCVQNIPPEARSIIAQ